MANCEVISISLLFTVRRCINSNHLNLILSELLIFWSLLCSLMRIVRGGTKEVDRDQVRDFVVSNLPVVHKNL